MTVVKSSPTVDEYGTKTWRNSLGQLHRIDGPAVEYADGHKEWWINGQLHRLDGPTVEDAYGHKEWWVNDQLHRIDGPAIEWSDGDREWYLKGNHFHIRISLNHYQNTKPCMLP